MSKEWDLFFYYEEADLLETIQQDIINGVVTKQNKLFYNRQDSAGVNDYENYPIGLSVTIGLRYEIVKWIAYRNTYIGDGLNSSKERRLVTSQNKIEIENNNNNIDINILYISFFNYNNLESINFPIGVN